MPKFASKCDNPPTVTPTTIDPSRAKLAEAITERQQARQAVDDARNAEATAREKTYEAQHRAAELRAEVEKQATSDDDNAVDAILAGGDGVLLLGKGATTEIHREIEALDQRAAAFKRAADLAEMSIPVRQKALAECDEAVTKAAKAVVLSAVDIERLLEESRIGAEWIINRRVTLLALLKMLPDGPEHAACSHFLGRAWLMPELDGTWEQNPSIAPLRAAFAALRDNASEPIEVAK